MDRLGDIWIRFIEPPLAVVEQTPLHLVVACTAIVIVTGLLSLFLLLHLLAPKPRRALASEKTYVTCSGAQTPTQPRQLPCWYDRWQAEQRLRNASDEVFPAAGVASIEPAELRLSVVFPAYNEEERIVPTLEEAVAYLDEYFGRIPGARQELVKRRHGRARSVEKDGEARQLGGYEILVVDDGSKDDTARVVLEFAKKHELHDVLRLVSLVRNRGKGGGVTHGLRHVRGQYALFADADGASRFSDVAKLIEGCEEVMDGSLRGVAIGSRAHLVGSEAVVQRSALRNFLMRSFHLVLTILTPPATSRIRDTQCGFKLLSRAALAHIVPYMHTEGWIFDIEMLMLAESAPASPVLDSNGCAIGASPGIKVAEVPIEWHEVGGSKLNVVRDSISMALGLAILRASWMLGVYRRRLS
ncbi:hypothetical protein CDD81_5891 [Ophiocordyceps australis]|uniref:dolichyl-phosphate beta-glucosyltransferase n=1 Tax=Ophiocordyceps australis TaxID=1399860 RepID=A0A2C5XC15_9HYPO|nr:hypothetical protein CDD81_5891 [Ophiocordyceps australis]